MSLEVYKMSSDKLDKLHLNNNGNIGNNVSVSSNSIYNLITKLCEKILNSQKNSVSKKAIAKCRSKAYEILLSKKISQQADDVTLEDNNDPYCYLLAWQYILINQHNMLEHACKLQKCIDTLQNSNSLNEEVLSDTLYILLKLRRLPEQNNVISINSSTSNALDSIMKFRHFDSTKFKLPVPMICSDSKFKNESFILQTKQNIKKNRYMRTRYSENDICKNCNIPVRISCSSLEITTKEDEGYESLPKDDQCDIWELVSKTEFDDRRTWETLENPCPSKELPFFTEAPSSLCSSLYNMHTYNILQLIGNDDNVKFMKTIKQNEFIYHLKLLLVGITSSSFKRDHNGDICLVSGITTEGITPSAMEAYCKDLIFCSCCYVALDNLCNFHSPLEDVQSHGFIFKEFCDSINRYLTFYRLTIQNISENSNLLDIHNYIRPLLSQLDVLASVCKVGPFTESKQLPNGVALLNYLYQKTIELTDKEVIMVLYSILYPCIQVYFNRFLYRWIFEGIVSDPYSEFFIVSNMAYLRTRGRTYWTRSHTVYVDVVPDFLSELAQDILLCGKTMNLLKLCVPSSPLCMYLMGKKPNLLSCCLSSDQIASLERNSVCYYLEASAECGPKFQITNLIMRSFEQNMIFMNLITKKRAATIRRLELEKLKKVEEEIERKHKAMTHLRKQYDEALQNKKLQLISEIEREMKLNEDILKMQNLRQKLVEEEALDMIEYYEKLNEISEKKQSDIQKHIQKLKRNDLKSPISSSAESSKENVSLNTSTASGVEDKSEEKSASSSNDTFISATSESGKQPEELEIADSPKVEIHISDSLDIINANSQGDTKITDGEAKTSELAHLAAENFAIARRNRAKVLNEEMGITLFESKSAEKPKISDSEINLHLTDLQKNRLKVLSSEFDFQIRADKMVRKKELSLCEINRRKNMTTNECFRMEDDRKKLEGGEIIEIEKKIIIPTYYNDNYNANLENNGNINERCKEEEENGNNIEESLNEIMKVEEKNILNNRTSDEILKLNNLKLDFSKLANMQQQKQKSSESIFSKFLKSPNFELERSIPMSIDSTPCTDTLTPKMQNSMDKEQLESNFGSVPTTAATNFTDEGFNFGDVQEKKEPVLFTRKDSSNDKLSDKANISKRVSIQDANNISTRSIKIFIQQSVSIPVNTQIKLVNNEVLKYIFVDLEFLTHLGNLRNYFFLLDGEFGRNITEGLFEKLYDVNFPIDLINCRTLQHLVYNAIDSSIKQQQHSNCLSFKINNLPSAFNLEDPEVLECLSLTYKVSWPLNILLPSDTIAKYDEVFKFLVKLHRVFWVLKKILQELKLFTKKSGSREAFLVLSPQFQKLHQYRHVMTHFVQTLQNYVVGEVLHTSWDAFEKKLINVNTIDEIYLLHVTYIKNILFMCLLNQRSLPIRKLILKIFMVILKFYNYLRNAQWEFDEEYGVFELPNFKKLEDIFQNFEEFAIYFVKVARKVAKVGYQPHLIQLLDMLNVNDYYTNKNVSSHSHSHSHSHSNNNTSVNSTANASA